MKQATLKPLSIITSVIVQGLVCTYALAAEVTNLNEEEIERIEVIGKLSLYSAVKTNTPIVETARSISVETQQNIIDKGALRLDDTFTYSAGVTGQTYGFSTRGDWVKVRGLDVPQYQDSLQSLFGNYNNTRPDVYTLEQVEILKGPASVLYGKGSPGGLVNAVSKRPKDESKHEVVASMGNFSRKQFAFDSTGAIDSDHTFLYRMVGVYRDSDTQVDFVDDNTFVIAPSLTWRPNDDSEISLLLNYTETESDTGAQFLPISGTLTPAPNGNYIPASRYTGESDFNKYDAETLSVTLVADYDLSEDWTVSVNSRYTDASADYQQAWTSFIGGDRYVYNADGSLYKDGTVPRTFYRKDATSDQAAIDIRLIGEIQSGDWQHALLMGTQYQDVTTDSDGYFAWAVGFDAATRGPDATFGDTYWLNLFDPEQGNQPPEALLDSLYSDNPKTKSKDLGIYLTDQISYDNWILTLGLRYDDSESKTLSARQKDDATSFSGGLLYAFDSGISPYVSFAESFDPVIGNNGHPADPQPLKPMEGEQWEFGVKYQPTAFPALMTLAYFDIEQSNLPDPLTNPGENWKQQSGVTTVTGFEFEAVGAIGDFTYEVNASRLNTDSPEGFQLASVPKNQASTWITYRPTNQLLGFKSGLGIRYTGESYGGADTIKTPSYTLYDLMLGYSLDQWDLSVNVQNLFDKDYQASCLYRGDCFPGNQRTLVGRVRYVF
ncbi:TonB-dependent siderophore receptor [Thalassomonas haliotis]|uniref:TonB-dependent siderophore receptor n=1 Tax=Thalassomonas haliotis TaxID=485448 RepID=A0ABY7V9F8_9GAMM|nr:TonB-dependent siderophore receptor [Thalassomonas haliotis]WDE10244.1 TonB-dependent siderophore receptor [Thalassomonas haliotis]